MSRFDAKDVNDNWTITRDEAGRKVAVGDENGRVVRVYVSDVRPDSTTPFEVMERYLLPILDLTIDEDGVVSEKKKLWVTRKQFVELNKSMGVPYKTAAKLDVLKAVASLVNRVIQPLLKLEGIPRDIVDEIIKELANEILTKNLKVWTE